MVDSAGDLEEDESSSVRSSDSEEDEPDDPRVQEKVSVVEMMAFPLRNYCISNSTEIGDFLKLVKLRLKIQHEYRAVSVWSVF